MASAQVPGRSAIIYPDSDGQPMADNTLQYEWMVTIKGGLDLLFRDDPDVFVAGDLLWYPVEGDNKTRTAPDAMVAFGRPKGDRGSYRQWEEGGIAPQVVFEVLSPGNRRGEMARKFRFYEKHGVEEYYVYDPDRVRLSGWLRGGGSLRPVAEMDGWTSPRLGVRFDLSSGDLRILGPDGRPLASYVELGSRGEEAERQVQEERRRREEAEHQREEAEHQREEEHRRREEAEHQRDEERRQGDEARLRAERLAARLRELGEEPE